MNQCKLLLIESDPLLQALLIDIFDDAGYDVYPAVHDDAVQIAEDFVPDVAMISDGPRGTFAAGWRTARRLHHACAALPLIMLSTNRGAVEEAGQTERGRLFVAGIRKPFTVDELLATVAEWHSGGHRMSVSMAPIHVAGDE